MKKKLKNIFLLILFIISFYLVNQLQKPISNVILSHQNNQSESVSTIARQITVRLLGEYISGSGVIISHQKNNIYYVLTCAHVLEGNPQNKSFQVLTFDQKIYDAEKENKVQFNNLDLAIIKFKSELSYAVAKINKNSFISQQNQVYVAGFPNLKYDQGDWRNTFHLGIEHYQFNGGKIEIKLSKPMESGYELGLTNDIEQGMSGGPLFNNKSELIGIIGRSKYGVGGAKAYKFDDGSYPSSEMLIEMESVSWAIPLYKFVDKLPLNNN